MRFLTGNLGETDKVFKEIERKWILENFEEKVRLPKISHMKTLSNFIIFCWRRDAWKTTLLQNELGSFHASFQPVA